MIKTFFNIGEHVIIQGISKELDHEYTIQAIIEYGDSFMFDGLEFKHISHMPAYHVGVFHPSGLPKLFLQSTLKKQYTPAEMSFKNLITTCNQI